jgi:hypothetical protein
VLPEHTRSRIQTIASVLSRRQLARPGIKTPLMGICGIRSGRDGLLRRQCPYAQGQLPPRSRLHVGPALTQNAGCMSGADKRLCSSPDNDHPPLHSHSCPATRTCSRYSKQIGLIAAGLLALDATMHVPVGPTARGEANLSDIYADAQGRDISGLAPSAGGPPLPLPASLIWAQQPEEVKVPRVLARVPRAQAAASAIIRFFAEALDRVSARRCFPTVLATAGSSAPHASPSRQWQPMRCTCLVFLYQGEIKTGNARFDGAKISLCFIYTGTEGLDDDGYPWCVFVTTFFASMHIASRVRCQGAVVRPGHSMRLHSERVIAACSIKPDGAPQGTVAEWTVLSRWETRVAWADMLQRGIEAQPAHRCHDKR